MDFRRRARFVQSNNGSPTGKRSCALAVEALEDRFLLAAGYGVVNLASDVPGLARVTDANLANPWGMAFSPTGPFWFADNTSGVSDLLDGRGQQIPLVVTVPGVAGAVGTPTGTVFNDGPGFVVSENGVFAASQFLFASLDGTISGWAPDADMTRAIVAVDNSASGAAYTGLAIATEGTGQSYIYAADFAGGKIDVLNQSFQPVQSSGAFVDANIPSGYAPFNIQNIGNLLYVTYATQNDGAGHGFVDVYDIRGDLVRRFASQGTLDAPWGLALAPADFGPLGGALLVANNGDGHINAFNPATGAYLGTLADDAGQTITVPDVWAISFGNGHLGGDTDALFFAAGLDRESHGIFGAIQSPQYQGADTGGTGLFDPSAPGERDDYPLPPSNGPALTSTLERATPTSVLLPLANSSLVMVPTLFAVPQAGSGVQAPAAFGPFMTASFARAGSTTLVASAANFVPDESQAPDGNALSGTFALSAFLDLDTLRDHTADTTASPDVVITAASLGTGGTRSPGLDAGVVSHYAQPEHIDPQTSVGAEHGRAFPSDTSAHVAVSVISQDVGPADAGTTVGTETATMREQGSWGNLLKTLLGVFGLSLAWGCSLVGRAKPRTSAATISREPAKTQVLPVP